MKATHLLRGEQVESAALAYLQSNGLTLVEKNYRCMYGEIDLIMMDKHDLVFVEVRYRKNDLFGGATQSIDANKQQKLRRTAETFMQKNHALKFDGCRFDVVAVNGQSANYKIHWLSDAF
ncbi:YraN family protein [Candidatus Spongiihabitans sp.]|uniref:YraN family protein n=1 Tax=Candidatus Spongiihabitans sp. TaxID=3101308 RepID=UPI003C7C1416